MAAGRVDITPDKRLLGNLGKVGYSTEQAIAELVDNSIDARIEGAREEVAVELDFARRRISVSDDGAGMDLEGLRRAWVLGAGGGAGPGRLGAFGIGMKSACSALGRSFTTRTTVAGSARELSATYDEDEWLGGPGGWTDFEVTESETGAARHGTTVSVSRLTVPLYRGQASQFRASLGERYAGYLLDGQVRITVNGRLCVPAQPAIAQGTRRVLDIPLPGGNRVHGWVALPRRRRAGGGHGLSLYKNGRMVTSRAKPGAVANLPPSGIVGDIHLDHVPVNVTKTGFLADSAAYREALGAVARSPEVRGLARGTKGRAGEPRDHELALDSRGEPVRLPGLGDRASRLMLDCLSESGPVGRGHMPVVLEDADSGVYRIVGKGRGAMVAVNRNSGLFRAFRNPVYLLGMLRIEAKMLSRNPDAQQLLSDRNREWERFVSAHSRARPATGQKRRDTLPENLAGLRELITSGFSGRFQFTALSILWPFLRNFYRVMPYTIHTTPHAGSVVRGIISEHDGYRALVDPGPGQVNTTIDALDGGSLVIIRERSDVPKSTAASYSKAWVDLYAETKRKCAGVYEEELKMFWDIDAYSLVSKDEILRFARRRKIGAEVQRYLEQED